MSNIKPCEGTGLRGAKGFTLLELMITIAIIGLLSALAAPNLLKWVSNSKVRSAGIDISTRVRTCRQEAVANALEYRIVIDKTKSTVQIDKGNNYSLAGTWTALEAPVIVGNGSTDITVTFSSASSSAKTFPTNGTIICTPEGSLKSTGNSFLNKDSFVQVSNGSRYYKAVITSPRNGKIRLEGPFFIP